MIDAVTRYLTTDPDKKIPVVAMEELSETLAKGGQKVDRLETDIFRHLLFFLPYNLALCGGY